MVLEWVWNCSWWGGCTCMPPPSTPPSPFRCFLNLSFSYFMTILIRLHWLSLVTLVWILWRFWRLRVFQLFVWPKVFFCTMRVIWHILVPIPGRRTLVSFTDTFFCSLGWKLHICCSPHPTTGIWAEGVPKGGVNTVKLTQAKLIAISWANLAKDIHMCRQW